MKTLVAQHKSGKHIGIYSVCSAHPLVIEATLRFALNKDNQVLIEATSNQVNQFGGYTGMKPQDFKNFVYAIAKQINFPLNRIILGGDHLGPNCWQNESSSKAMEKAKQLVIAYVSAGFSKIHLDASMPCADDSIPLPPDIIAQRAAELCQAIESHFPPSQLNHISYIIGTEVPVPGGESHAILKVAVTTVESAKQTIESHCLAFQQLGLEKAFERVVGIVVQPGVEFDHSKVILYQPEKTTELSKFIESTPYIFEAHSTDYQTKESYFNLVRDHFAILKVGPALTFALREALFALAKIEDELIMPEQRSQLIEVIDEVMQDDPHYWKKYYSTQHSKAMLDIHFSLSDRIRYYWPNQRIQQAVGKLIKNLDSVSLPLGILSQYFPAQYQRLLKGQIQPRATSLIMDKIQAILRDYAFGCEEQQ